MVLRLNFCVSFLIILQSLLTLSAPYNDYKGHGVVVPIMKNELPNFPQEILSSNDSSVTLLRDVCVKCWEGNPSERPKMKEVLRLLEERSCLT